MKLLTYVLIAVIFVLTAGNVLQSCERRILKQEAGIDKATILKQQRRTEKQIDSMVVEQEILEAKGRALALKYEASQKELDKRHAEANQWRKKYANLKNTPVPDWSHNDLDSIIWAITN